MKHLLLSGLLLLLYLLSFGQSVPNTTTFSLQDVINAVNPTTDDLQDCFNDAIADYFNPTYEGSKNSLLNFRDYGSHNATYPSYYATGGIVYRSSGNVITLSMPSTYTSNQVAVAVITLVKTGVSSGNITTPSGWTKIGEYTADTQYNVWYAKSLNGAEPASYDFTQNFSNFSYMWGAIFTYNNASNFSTTNATTGVYGNSTGFSVNHTVTTDRLGVNYCSIKEDENINVSGDFSEDDYRIDFGFNISMSATSVIGDGTSKSVTYSWTTSVPYASSYNGLEIY